MDDVEQTIRSLEQIKGFVSCRMSMAMPGEASILLGSWVKAIESAIGILQSVAQEEAKEGRD